MAESNFRLTLDEPELIPIDFAFGGSKAKTLHLRPFNVLDEKWLADTFGDDDIVDKVINEQDLSHIFKIFVHQLVEADRAYLALALDTDDNGLVDTLLNIVPVDPNADYNPAQEIMAVVFRARSVSLPEKLADVKKKMSRRYIWTKLLRRFAIGTILILIGFWVGRFGGF